MSSSKSGRTSPRFMGPIQPHSSRRPPPVITPGPGSYDTPTSIGKQSSSSRPSSPRYSFGSGKRETFAKQFVTEELASKNPRTLTATIDFHDSSNAPKYRGGPKYSMPKSPRDQYLKTVITKEHQLHIPNEVSKNVDFLSHDAAAKAALSNRPSSPRYGFGSGKRDKYVKQWVSKELTGRLPTDTTAGVDFYATTASVGKQVVSTKSTAPAHGFGTSDREARERTYFVKR